MPGAQELIDSSWARSKRVTSTQIVSALSSTLGKGESEAIALALELDADLVLMDERRGRRVARQMGNKVIGVIGILTEARAKGQLEKLQPVLDQLIMMAGFRISEALYNQVLKANGEG